MLGSSIDSLMQHRLPGRRVANLRRRRRQHRPYARGHAREDGAVSRLGLPSAPREGRPGQGAHAQPRPQGNPRRGLGRGRDDHRRRRALRAADLAAHGPPPCRPEVGASRPTSRKAASRPTCCRASSHSSTSRPRRRRGAPRTSSARSPAWPAAPSCTAARTSWRSAAPSTPARSPRTPSRRSRRSSPGGASCSTPTPSSGPRNPTASRPCGSSACAGARGNLQITGGLSSSVVHQRPAAALGGVPFGVLWFSAA